MCGLIGKMLAQPGKRDELVRLLPELPAVQAAISRARPLIAGFGERFETNPVGGVGWLSNRPNISDNIP